MKNVNTSLCLQQWQAVFVAHATGCWSSAQTKMLVTVFAIWFVLLGSVHLAMEQFFLMQVLFFIVFHKKVSRYFPVEMSSKYLKV